MAKLLIIRTGQTAWEAQARFESVQGTPLTDVGADYVDSSAKELAAEKIKAIYTADGTTEKQTAELIAKKLDAKIKVEPLLHEMDFGLWQGLTDSELKRRQPKMFKQWTESPDSVRPPGGETLAEVQGRLCETMKQILKKNKKSTTLLVLRPIALEMLRCRLSGYDRDAIWNRTDPEFSWVSYEMDPNEL